MQRPIKNLPGDQALEMMAETKTRPWGETKQFAKNNQ